MAGPQLGGSCRAPEAAWSSFPGPIPRRLRPRSAAGLFLPGSGSRPAGEAAPALIYLQTCSVASQEGPSGAGTGIEALLAGLEQPSGAGSGHGAAQCPRHLRAARGMAPGSAAGLGERVETAQGEGWSGLGESRALLCLLRDPEQRLGACVSQLVPGFSLHGDVWPRRRASEAARCAPSPRPGAAITPGWEPWTLPTARPSVPPALRQPSSCWGFAPVPSAACPGRGPMTCTSPGDLVVAFRAGMERKKRTRVCFPIRN